MLNYSSKNWNSAEGTREMFRADISNKMVESKVSEKRTQTHFSVQLNGI
jgi:hypothetical protein